VFIIDSQGCWVGASRLEEIVDGRDMYRITRLLLQAQMSMDDARRLLGKSDSRRTRFGMKVACDIEVSVPILGVLIICFRALCVCCVYTSSCYPTYSHGLRRNEQYYCAQNRHIRSSHTFHPFPAKNNAVTPTKSIFCPTSNPKLIDPFERTVSTPRPK
jgi:hypothetical protein